MDIKTELKDHICERFKATASKSFLERATAVIDGATDEKENLITAADRVSRMVTLFIDKNAGKEIYGELKQKINESFPES
ncbi:MAG TPA: hypothetical protein VN328_04515 [Thermodesulfovibrionales bacterium]|nr:hypothetical protein [Thermodesulfovibrionales bacterium]